MRLGFISVAAAECVKIAAQFKAAVVLLACIAGPFVFAVAMRVQSSLPVDTLFGRSVKESGFAIPLVVLGFAALWAFPVLTSVVGGDLFSAEDRYGTWSTLFTRSRSRAEVFAGKVLTGMLLAIAALTALGCGTSPITSARIETAIARTFANLVHVQMSSLGLPPIAAADFGATASCRKLAEGPNSGSGEWSCTLNWQGPDRQRLRDTFDLFVAADGCYMATVSGENLGGPTLRAENGQFARNLLYAFEGCFDTT